MNKDKGLYPNITPLSIAGEPAELIVKDLAYWKKRCELAEDYIGISENAPAEESDKAYQKWNEFKQLP